MFFLSLMLFAWLVFDWHAALPMMIALMWATRGAWPARSPASHRTNRRTHRRPLCI